MPRNIQSNHFLATKKQQHFCVALQYKQGCPECCSITTTAVPQRLSNFITSALLEGRQWKCYTSKLLISSVTLFPDVAWQSE